jgi:hypothetical protein
MPSGLRVTRIDRAPAAGPLHVVINGRTLAGLVHHTSLELTVAPGELLLEILATGFKPVFQVLAIAAGCTAQVRIGRRCSLGLMDSSHYLHVDRPLLGLPDRTLHPLNLSARSALQWLREKRALGEELSPAQLTYLHTHLPPTQRAGARHRPSTIPSLAELGAFAALGLDPVAGEEDVRQAYRLLKSLHGSDARRSTDTLHRLDEAFRVAMEALSRRGVHADLSEVGR